jgi:hypothetical protein
LFQCQWHSAHHTLFRFRVQPSFRAAGTRLVDAGRRRLSGAHPLLPCKGCALPFARNQTQGRDVWESAGVGFPRKSGASLPLRFP